MAVSLAEVVRAFGAEPNSIRLIQARANAHWRVHAGPEVFVLRRYADTPGIAASAAWEQALIDDLAGLGWPVARSIAPPREISGRLWLLMAHVGGRSISRGGKVSEATYRRVGGILARLHLSLERLPPRPQRPGWGALVKAHLPVAGGAERRDALLARLDRVRPDMADRFRPALKVLEGRRLPQVFEQEPRHPIHGDFAPWNLLQRGGALSGLLDFEIGHVDVLAADVALARRGYHDAVVDGYLEVRKLPAQQLAALDGLWLACLFYGLWSAIDTWERNGVDRPADLDWNLEQLGKTRPYRPA